MKKILVVEDAHSLRKDIVEMLNFEGYEAVGAENGLVGVERARDLLPDLIICDIMMPGLDGYGVLEELHKELVTATIPFIFLTARADRVDVRQGMELGADDFLIKPFHAAELLATVRTRLEKREIVVQQSEQRLDELRGNIMLALPHEMRTPLNIILGFSELIMTDASLLDSERIADMARLINSGGMRLYRVIENFLLYAQTEVVMTDRNLIMAFRKRYTLLPRMSIERNARLHAERVGRANDVRFEVEEVEAIKMGDDFIKKITEELVDNACKFSSENTPIRVNARREGDQYVLSVTNHGRGMTREQINRVGAYMQFERRLYEQQGTGLGLILCKRLAEIHGGSLEIESVREDVTTVTVRLPIEQDVHELRKPG